MDKLFSKKNSIALLIPAIVGNVIMLVINVRESGSFGIDLPIILLSTVYAGALKQIEEPQKFQCIPAFLMFWLTAARIVCCLKDFSNTAGIIVMLPVAAGCIYSLAGTVKLWREFFKNTKNTKGGTRQ